MPADIIGTNIVMEDPAGGTASSSSSTGRSSPASCWPTKSTAPRPRRSRPCWRPCRSTPSPSAARRYTLDEPFFVHGHAEPHRAGRHLSAARGPARPLLLQAGRGLLDRARSSRRSSTARRPAIKPKIEPVMTRGRDHRRAAAGAAGGHGPARAGLRRPAGDGHAPGRRVRDGHDQPVRPLGHAARAAPRRSRWRPRCTPCSTGAST